MPTATTATATDASSGVIEEVGAGQPSNQERWSSGPADGGHFTKPAHFARLRSFALNILRANGTTNVSRELYLNALNPQNALSYQIT